MSSIARLVAEFKRNYQLSPEANVVLSAFALWVERRENFMLSTDTVNRFNVIRVLIYCGSPQVRERDGYIEIVEENGEIRNRYTVKLAFPGAYDELRRMIRDKPLSVKLVEWHEVAAIRDLSGRDLAYMLP